MVSGGAPAEIKDSEALISRMVQIFELLEIIGGKRCGSERFDSETRARWVRYYRIITLSSPVLISFIFL